jgi:hypothetical protein
MLNKHKVMVEYPVQYLRPQSREAKSLGLEKYAQAEV